MTDISPLDVEGLLAALDDASVRYVVIGGFAVGAHGYPRATREFAAEEVVQPDAAGLEGSGNFVLSTSRGRLDVMQIVGPDLEYADLERD